jgi:hypothetical protein
MRKETKKPIVQALLMKKGGKPNPLKFFNDNRAKAVAKAGGAIKKTKKMVKGGPTDPNKYVMNKTNVFGKHKNKEISKNKFNRLSNRYVKQEGSESLGDNKSISQQVISGRNPKKSVTRVNEVKKAEFLKKRGRGFKKGGSTIAKKTK